MNRLHARMKGSNQEGMALAIVVLLLAVLSAAAFAFIFKVGAKATAANSRGTYLQARYLAESAANRALWRLLNEPGFPEDEDVYYMHSLGQGRESQPLAPSFLATRTWNSQQASQLYIASYDVSHSGGASFTSAL